MSPGKRRGSDMSCQVFFCAECLHPFLKLLFWEDHIECEECHCNIYFKAILPENIKDGIYKLSKDGSAEPLPWFPIGELMLVLATTKVKLWIVDSREEELSRGDVLNRISEGLSGNEGYAYYRERFAKAVQIAEKIGVQTGDIKKILLKHAV